MTKNKMRIGALLAVMLIMSMALVTPVNAQMGKDEELPSFQPSMKDKMSYEEEHRLMKNVTSTPPLPESELAQIVFSEAWILENDKDKRSDAVKVTFPTAWLNNPSARADEPIVLLQIPKKMLELDDTDKDSQLITISYPVDFFMFYQNIAAVAIDEPNVRDSISTKEVGVQAIEYAERAWYQRDTSYTVTRVTGTIDPTSYSNQGETFRSYHEREIYLNRNGDTAEFISDITDNGNVYVWAALYDEGTWETPWDWLQINVTESMQPVEYYFYITSGVYEMWLKDTSTSTWYYNSYNDADNPSTRINWLTGSTEIATRGGISNYFRIETNPIRDDWTYAGQNWYRPGTTFNWNSYSADQQYVDIFAWLDGNNRINTQHTAGSAI